MLVSSLFGIIISFSVEPRAVFRCKRRGIDVIRKSPHKSRQLLKSFRSDRIYQTHFISFACSRLLSRAQKETEKRESWRSANWFFSLSVDYCNHNVRCYGKKGSAEWHHHCYHINLQEFHLNLHSNHQPVLVLRTAEEKFASLVNKIKSYGDFDTEPSAGSLALLSLASNVKCKFITYLNITAEQGEWKLESHRLGEAEARWRQVFCRSVWVNSFELGEFFFMPSPRDAFYL